jgi:hypothetical protein
MSSSSSSSSSESSDDDSSENDQNVTISEAANAEIAALMLQFATNSSDNNNGVNDVVDVTKINNNIAKADALLNIMNQREDSKKMHSLPLYTRQS